jgi:hypothetical protein
MKGTVKDQSGIHDCKLVGGGGGGGSEVLVVDKHQPGPDLLAHEPLQAHRA